MILVNLIWTTSSVSWLVVRGWWCEVNYFFSVLVSYPGSPPPLVFNSLIHPWESSWPSEWPNADRSVVTVSFYEFRDNISLGDGERTLEPRPWRCQPSGPLERKLDLTKLLQHLSRVRHLHAELIDQSRHRSVETDGLRQQKIELSRSFFVVA